MALSNQDFVKGEDLTGVSPVTSADLNNLVDLAVTKEDTNGDGKGLIVRTFDTALDTPVVPDASITTKWKRYLWVRIQDASVADKTPLVYAWNDNATDDATLLKWKQTTVDITQFQAQIDSSLAQSQAAQAAANTALITANNAASLANSANTNATDALSEVQGAIDNSAAASTAAAAALSTANEAKALAQQASTDANAKHDVNAILNPGTAGQHVRTNAAGNAVEWYDEDKQYVKVSYTEPKGTIAEAGAVNTWKKRTINTEDNDAGNLVSLALNIITFAVPGKYRVLIRAPAEGVTQHAAVLVDEDANTVLLNGTTEHASTGTLTTNHSLIAGIITITNTVKNLAIYHYVTGANGKLGSSIAMNLQYNGVDRTEPYMICEFWKIN